MLKGINITFHEIKKKILDASYYIYINSCLVPIITLLMYHTCDRTSLLFCNLTALV